MDVRFYPAAAGDPAGLDFAQCLGYYGYSKVTGPGAAGRGPPPHPGRTPHPSSPAACCTFLSPFPPSPPFSLGALVSDQLSPLPPLFLPLPPFVPLGPPPLPCSPPTPTPTPPTRLYRPEEVKSSPRLPEGACVGFFVVVVSKHGRSPLGVRRGPRSRGPGTSPPHSPSPSHVTPRMRELDPRPRREGKERTFECALDGGGGGGWRGVAGPPQVAFAALSQGALDRGTEVPATPPWLVQVASHLSFFGGKG